MQKDIVVKISPILRIYGSLGLFKAPDFKVLFKAPVVLFFGFKSILFISFP